MCIFAIAIAVGMTAAQREVQFCGAGRMLGTPRAPSDTGTAPQSGYLQLPSDLRLKDVPQKKSDKILKDLPISGYLQESTVTEWDFG
jgi:hypothetical protein